MKKQSSERYGFSFNSTARKEKLGSCLEFGVELIAQDETLLK